MLPISMTAEFGKMIGYATFFLVGFGFGAALEMAGFGDSRKLAAQFYFKDMTVLKTMFTGILVTCLLIFFFSSLGVLDFSKIFVVPTYLWPGIVGGLIMGVGFIVGGYCPGTSVVSAASFKVDGILFFIGTMIGAGFFGETVEYFEDFWNSSYSERLLVSDWLGWSVGATVFGVSLLALAMFYGAEMSEEYFRAQAEKRIFSWRVQNAWLKKAAFGVLALSLVTWYIGQPSAERKWEMVSAKYEPLLTARSIFVHPLEYVKTWNDASIKLETLDLRSEKEFREFHLAYSRRMTLEDVNKPEFIASLTQLPSQGVAILVSEDEALAVRAWQLLKAQGVVNLYILDRGLLAWQQFFSQVELPHEKLDLKRPSSKVLEQFPKDSYETKIKLKTVKRSGGLCS